MRKDTRKNLLKRSEQARRRAGQPPDEYDLMRMHVLEGAPLDNQKLLARLEKMREIWPILVSGRPLSQVVKQIVKLEICKRSHAYKLIADTKKLFGDAFEATRGGEKAVLVEMLKKCYRIALKEGDAKSATAAAKEIAKLQGLYDEGQNLEELYAQLDIGGVIFSDDPRILEAEDVEYTVIQDETEDDGT